MTKFYDPEPSHHGGWILAVTNEDGQRRPLSNSYYVSIDGEAGRVHAQNRADYENALSAWWEAYGYDTANAPAQPEYFSLMV